MTLLGFCVSTGAYLMTPSNSGLLATRGEYRMAFFDTVREVWRLSS
jgi:hypothetical protein